MEEQMTEEINYRKGYDKGWSDAQEYLAKKFEKILAKNANKSYLFLTVIRKWFLAISLLPLLF